MEIYKDGVKQTTNVAIIGTVPVSGTFWQATQPISAASLPLPSGASTEATLASLLTELQAKADLAETQPVSAASLPLPSGASTAANQSTIIGHVDGIEGLLTTIDADTGIIAGDTTSIDGKTPALGQALEAASTPVVLPASQITTLTPQTDALTDTQLRASAVVVDGSGVTQPISASSLPLPSGAATAANQLADGHNVTVDNASGASAVNIQDGGNSITVDGTFWQTTQPVSGTITASNTAGDIAHDAADSGNPIKVGGKAVAFDGTAPGTDVAESDRANFITTVEGRQFVETAHPNYFSASVDYAAAQTNATIKAAAGAGLKLYITDILVSNGATAGNITLLDGSGGSVLYELYPAINGGAAHSFRTPIALTANTLLAITSTTVTTHSITVSGFIAA